MFFVFEGIDGSGKTTQISRVEKRLAETPDCPPVLRTHEPGGWEGGERVREFLLKGELVNPWSEFFLFMMDRCEHVDRVIKPALAEGMVVLSDRYMPSSIAYQLFGSKAATAGTAEYIIRMPDEIGLPRPDAIFLLDVDIETAQARVRSRGKLNAFDELGRSFFASVREGYEKIKSPDDGWITIDARGSEDEVFDGLMPRISAMLKLEPA
jgi:dTMP kinase